MSEHEHPAIVVQNVNKSFKLPHEKQTSLKGALIGMTRGKRTYEEQKVLNDINFTINKGDFFGIVGRNGSGKSTLLKLLAGIYVPDSGNIHVNGSLAPFIELGVGFNPELTGRENVYLNGTLLGFTHKQIDKMYDEIVEFAELEKFMDQKLKNYSSGMQVRLAFSIAIRAKSDILLIDEVLAVGDSEFQQKCFEYFKHLKKIKKTVVLVSHDQNAIIQYCNKAIYIESGKILANGKTRDVMDIYLKENEIRAERLSEKEVSAPKYSGQGGAKIVDVYTSGIDGNKIKTYRPKDIIKITFKIKINSNISNPIFGMLIFDEVGNTVFATNTLDKSIITKFCQANSLIEVEYSLKNFFKNGKYGISGAIANKDRTLTYNRIESATYFRSVSWMNTAVGQFNPEHNIVVRTIKYEENN